MKNFTARVCKSLFTSLLVLPLLACESAAQTPAKLDTPERVETYLKTQMGKGSQDVALAVYSVNEDGTLQTSEGFSYNAEAPMPLASTVKIVVLAAYAQAVAEGTLSPDEEVDVAAWEAYYLPLTDGGAHPAALESLGIASDDLGFAQEGAAVRLDDIAGTMIVHSDNAGTDYLMDRLGDAALTRVSEDNALAQQDLPLSILGMFLAWQNAESPQLTLYPEGEFRAATERYKARYLEDAAWREAQLEWLGSLTAFPSSYGEQVEAYQSFTQGSAEDYARIMGGVVTETFISPEASRVMRRHLEWPMRSPGNQEVFETFGTKGGSLSGVLTEALYLVPKTGDFAGEARVAVLFLNHLSEASFTDLSESFAQQEMLINAALERAATKRLRVRE